MKLFILIAVMWAESAAPDQIQYLALPQQSLSAFATAIGGAQNEIDIATFIYQPCDASVRVLADLLAKKARAGVRVRVLLDALQQPIDQLQNLENEFTAQGIELRLYSASLIDINLRMHAKFTVIDGQQLIAGGRNFSDEYFDLSSTLNYVDRDILAKGPSAEDAASLFDQLWNSDMVSPAPGLADSFVNWKTFCSDPPSASISNVRKYLQLNAASNLQAIPVRTCQIHFTVDNPDFYKLQYGPSWDNGRGKDTFLTAPRLSLKHATQAVLEFLRGTNQFLFVENYDYIPITNLEVEFRALRRRGVPVKVLSNQDGDDGPDLFIQAEEYEYAKSQSEDSVGSEWIGLVSSQGSLSTAFELTPSGTPFFIHEKVATRDGTDLLIGSFNMDSRSANINIETASTITDCPDLVSDMMAHYQIVYQDYESDQNSSAVPPKPDPGPFAALLGDLLLPEL